MVSRHWSTDPRPTILLFMLFLAFSFAHGGLIAAAGYEPGTPSTFLYDTGTSSAGVLPAAKLDPKAGWTLLPEDDLTHKFRGDAVVLNDRLALVLRGTGTGAEVYGQTPAGPKYRVEIAPRTASGRKPASLASLRIVENGPAAVALDASFALADGSSCPLKYRITAGQMIVEVRPGQGTDRLAVLAKTRYLVIPDFFGDDMVFGSQTVSRPRLRLPAENMLLSLLDGGDAQVMCVWSSNRQEAAATSIHGGAGAADRRLRDSGSRGQAALGRLPGGGRPVARTERPLRRARPCEASDWKPPFPAKWRR